MSVIKNETVPRININSLRNIEEMKEAFNQLCSEEERVNGELDFILANQVGLETRLRGITKIAPKLGEVGVDTEQLAR